MPMEPTILRYPIPGKPHGGLLHVYGDPEADDVILYCGGYPDGVEPFAELARRLARSSDGDDDDGCFVGITCYPGFDHESFRKEKFRGYRREGYAFEEVARCIREAAARLFAECDKTNGEPKTRRPQFTVIFHDFGVVPGLMFANRSIEEKLFFDRAPDRIVLLDVLVGPHPKFRPRQRVAPYNSRENLVYLAYRGANACGFAAMRYVSEMMGVIVFGILTGIVRMLGLEPLRKIDKMLLARRGMSTRHMVYAAYPYYNLFRAVMYDQRALAHATLPLDLDRTPILYIYGSDKNVNFHDRRSLAMLEREEKEGRSGCRVVRVEGAGHWMYCQRPEVCEEEVRRFLRGGERAEKRRVGNERARIMSKL